MRIWTIARKDLVQVLRDRQTFLFLAAMPVAFTLFIGAVFRFDAGPAQIPVGVLVARDDDPAAQALLALLAEEPSIRLERTTGEPERLRQAVDDGDLAVGLAIPQGFDEALYAGRPLPAALFVGASTEARAAEVAVRAAASRLLMAAHAAGLSAQDLGPDDPEAAWEGVLTRATALWADRMPQLTTVAAGTLEVVPSGYAQSSPGIMVQFAIFGVITSATVLVIERTSGTLRRTLTTPARATEILVGHLAAMLILALMQLGLLVAFGQLVLGLDYMRAPVATLLMMLSLAAFATGLGMLIGAVARVEDQVILYGLVAMFVLAGLGGAWFPLEITGRTFAAIGRLTPTAHAMRGFQNVILRGEGLGGVWRPALVLTAWATVLTGAAVWRLKRT